MLTRCWVGLVGGSPATGRLQTPTGLSLCRNGWRFPARRRWRSPALSSRGSGRAARSTRRGYPQTHSGRRSRGSALFTACRLHWILQLAAAGVEDCTALLRLPGTAEGPLAEWVPAAVRFAAEVCGAGPVRLHRTPFLLAAAAAGARAAVAAELSHAYEVVEFARLGCVPARGASRPGLPLLRQR